MEPLKTLWFDFRLSNSHTLVHFSQTPQDLYNTDSGLVIMILSSQVLLDWTHPSQRTQSLGFLISQYKSICAEQAGSTKGVNISDNVRLEERMRALRAHYNRGRDMSMLEPDTPVAGHKRKINDSDSDSEDSEDSEFEGGDSDSDSDDGYEPIHKSTRFAMRRNLITDLSSSLLRPERSTRR